MCLTSLKQVLPNDVAVEAILKYYALSNGLHSDERKPDEEWQCFCEAIWKLLGCQLDRGSSFDDVSPFISL